MKEKTKKLKRKKFKHLTSKERENIRKTVQFEMTRIQEIISERTGYYMDLEYSIFEDELRKTLDVDINLALVEPAHSCDEAKVKHYLKVNPDNCLNEPIIVKRYESWYKIYDGCHRLEANRRLGKKKIKAKIIDSCMDRNSST